MSRTASQGLHSQPTLSRCDSVSAPRVTPSQKWLLALLFSTYLAAVCPGLQSQSFLTPPSSSPVATDLRGQEIHISFLPTDLTQSLSWFESEAFPHSVPNMYS